VKLAASIIMITMSAIVCVLFGVFMEVPVSE
jgi:hypothetical protein